MSSRQRKPSKAQRKAQSARDKARSVKPTPPPAKKRAPRIPGLSAAKIGRTLGGVFGPTGAALGAGAGQLFKHITGFGDYKVNNNTLLSDPVPAFGNMSVGTRVRHREYLMDVITSDDAGAFSIVKVPIQPALRTSFPLLSATAENYQEYVISGCIFEFKSNSYDAISSTNTASGTVVMSTNYNALDPDFNSKFQMEQSQFTCSGKPSVCLIHPIECSRKQTPTNVFFTRSGPTPPGDSRFYDWGNFYIATVGMQGSATNIGELWVSYDIELIKPRLGSTVDVYDHYVLAPLTVAPGGPSYFGFLDDTHDPPQLTKDSDMGTSLASSNDDGSLDTIVWPSGYTGKVQITYVALTESKVASSLSAPYGVGLGGGASLLNCLGEFSTCTNQGSSLYLLYNGYGGVTLTVFVDLVNGGSVILFDGTSGAALRAADLLIVALPTNFGVDNQLSPPPLRRMRVGTCLDRKSLSICKVEKKSRPHPPIPLRSASPTPSRLSEGSWTSQLPRSSSVPRKPARDERSL